MGIVIDGKRKPILCAELVEAIHRHRTKALEDCHDEQRFREWLQTEAWVTVHQKLQMIPPARKDALEPFMTLQDWCHALDVPFHMDQTLLPQSFVRR